MAYPELWTCPSCNTVVYNSRICPTCSYVPPAESGDLTVQKISNKSLLKERVLAFIIDLTIIIGLSLLVSVATAYAMQDQSYNFNTLFMLFSIPISLVFLFFHPIYFFLLEAKYAQTYGKKIMKLKISGQGWGPSAKRNFSRFLEMIPLYIPAILMIRKSGKRWGDKLSNLEVIKV